MNLSYKKILVGSLVIMLTMVTAMMPGLSAEEAVIRLGRAEAAQKAVDYSPTVKNLEMQVTNMSTTYTDLADAMSGLEALYDLLPTYKTLYNSYQAIDNLTHVDDANHSDNYYDYLRLITSLDAGENAQALRMIDLNDVGEVVVGEPAASMDVDAETALLAAVGNPANMQPAAYGQYAALQPQFAAAGITNPNLSKDEEFDTFVYPISVSTLELSAGLKALSSGAESAKVGVETGALTLYDTILMLEGYLTMQEMSYASALEAFESAELKYQNGQISVTDYTIAKNNEEIARRNRDKMARDVENTMMSLNVMLGQDVTAQLDLFTPILEPMAIQDLQSYIDKGLAERSEVVSAKDTLDNKESIFDIYEDYYSKSSDEYQVAKSAVTIAEFDYDKAKLETEINIRAAYQNLLEKKQNLETKQLAYEDGTNSYENAKLNRELGFITDGILQNLEMLYTQSKNDYFVAYREYMTAEAALTNASGFGPAFSEGGVMLGGMTGE